MTEPALDEQGLPTGYRLREDMEVTPRSVRDWMAAGGTGGDMVLVDCRTAREHQVARIDGALLIPLQEIAARLEDLEEHRDRPIVVFCHHGMRSLQMTAILRQQGFANVMSMAGGIDLWSRDIDPTVPRY